MRNQLNIDYADACRITDASLKVAQNMGVAVSAVVLDASGHPVLMARMDGAAFQTPEVAKGKALTSAMMKKSSAIIEAATISRPTFVSFRDGRLPIQGGLPLFSGELCIGAIGVSGGSPEQDELIAQAGVDALFAG